MRPCRGVVRRFAAYIELESCQLHVQVHILSNLAMRLEHEVTHGTPAARQRANSERMNEDPGLGLEASSERRSSSLIHRSDAARCLLTQSSLSRAKQSQFWATLLVTCTS
jgi:hypothetical protein